MMENIDLSLIFNKRFNSKGLKSLLKQVLKEDLEIAIAIMTGYEYNLTKNELIDFISVGYEEMIPTTLKSYSSEIIEIIKILIDNDGELEYNEEINPALILLLKMYLVVFPVKKDGKNFIIMPNEILYFFKNFDFDSLNDQIKDNDTVVKYTRSLLETYGYFEVDKIFEYLNEYEDKHYELDDYFLLINNDSMIYGYEFQDNILNFYEIEEIPHFHETRKKYKNIDYYHLSKKQIDEGFPLTDEEEDLLYFYMNQLDMDEDFAYQGLQLLKDSLQIEMPISDIKNLLRQFSINTYEYKQLEKIVDTMANNIHLWSLKGHTRNEIKLPKLIRFPNKKE